MMESATTLYSLAAPTTTADEARDDRGAAAGRAGVMLFASLPAAGLFLPNRPKRRKKTPPAEEAW